MRIRENNKGLSLVEIIVVVAIMGILVGLMVPALSLLFSKDALKSAEVIQGELDKVRSYTIAKQGNWTLNIEKGASNYTIQIVKEEGGTETVIETTKLPEYIGLDVDSMVVKFRSSNGSVESVTVNGSKRDPNPIEKIRVTSTRDPSETIVVSLVKLTGRHYIGE